MDLTNYHNFYDTVLEGVQILNYNYEYIYVNDAVLKQANKQKSELLNKKIFEIYPNIKKTKIFIYIDELLNCDDFNCFKTLETKFKFPDNRIGYYHLKFKKIPEGVIIFSLDKSNLHNIKIKNKQLSIENVILHKKTIEIEEKERKRIAGEIHDNLAQILAAAKMHLNLAKVKNDFSIADKLISDAINEARVISLKLNPKYISQNLINLINDLISYYNYDENFNYINVQYDKKIKISKLDNYVKLNIYRIVQELINNSLKHAKAKQIKINFKSNNKNILIEYADDGVGINKKTLNSPSTLRAIKSRVSILKGQIQIKHLELGVAITIKIPISNFSY
ncbi:MAG: sensor histidine kinase [Vicingaceae bacterium]